MNNSSQKMIKIEKNTYFSTCLDVLDDLKLELSQDAEDLHENRSKNTHASESFSKEERLRGRQGDGRQRNTNVTQLSRFCHNVRFDQILFVKWSILFAFSYILSFE